MEDLLKLGGHFEVGLLHFQANLVHLLGVVGEGFGGGTAPPKMSCKVDS